MKEFIDSIIVVEKLSQILEISTTVHGYDEKDLQSLVCHLERNGIIYSYQLQSLVDDGVMLGALKMLYSEILGRTQGKLDPFAIVTWGSYIHLYKKIPLSERMKNVADWLKKTPEGERFSQLGNS